MRSGSLRFIKIKEYGWACLKMPFFHMKDRFGVIKLEHLKLQRSQFCYLLKVVGNGKLTGLSRLTRNSMIKKAGHTQMISVDPSTKTKDFCISSEEENGSESQQQEESITPAFNKWASTQFQPSKTNKLK